MRNRTNGIPDFGKHVKSANNGLIPFALTGGPCPTLRRLKARNIMQTLILRLTPFQTNNSSLVIVIKVNVEKGW